MRMIAAACLVVSTALIGTLRAGGEEASPDEIRDRRAFSIPEPSLKHLRALSDGNGIFEHAAGTAPNKTHGYCAEDAGRALAAVLMFNRYRPGDRDAAELAGTYMAYLRKAQEPGGDFHHRMDAQGNLSAEPATEDAYGRVLWGLGVAAAYPADPGMGASADEMFKRALPRARSLKWPRGMAYAMMGLNYYLERYPDSAQAQEAMAVLADALVRLYEDNSAPDWQWFENEATYDNARLPHALFLAYRHTGKSRYLDAARKTLDFLIGVNFREPNMLRVIGNRGWLARGGPDPGRGGEPALYDQQPIDAAGMVEACAEAYRLLGAETYKENMRIAFEWFLGNNVAGRALFDPSTGGSRDGINEDGINENQGAESSILFLIANLTMAEPAREELEVSYKGPSQVEIGGPFVGIELHEGSPFLNRLNLYYPVANSVDSSTGYWQRGGSRVMFLGLKVAGGPKTWIDPEGFEYQLTPYRASFRKSDGEKTIRVAYEFCKNKPAMTVTIELTNESSAAKEFELYSHLEASVKTSHTAALKDKAWTQYDQAGSSIYVNYESSETGDFQMFAANAAQQPAGFIADSAAAGFPGTDGSRWMSKDGDLPGTVISRPEPRRPAIAYVYKKNLAPKETMAVVQIIGSAKRDEGRELVQHLLGNFRSETRLYERFVLDKALREGFMETGDAFIDRSARWAKAVLAVNRHHLDRETVPMPCPAEYNFFFTHDALMTDLAAVNFDPGRVKRDLEYLAAHAGADGVIPHAYYWKDGRYVTEFAGADNWNHFWFIMVSGAYLRRSGDAESVRKLYPLLAKSVRQMLSNKKDHLIWAYRPDWWDLGNSFGPRSYMTILAIRALREFAYVSTALQMSPSESADYESEAAKMQEQLNARLWDKSLNYFINYYGDGKKDEHLYIGSLLAAHFNLADPGRKAALIETAREKLLDARTGIYNAFPMDFHKLERYLKFNGPEGGEPFYYMNGGIWAHGNAWYSLALVSAGKKDEAFRFMKDVMTVDGIRLGPNGQYAMYECRNGDRRSPAVYGTVDKPQFLWAAGWYLYALYRLLGVRENEWNISLEPWLAGSMARSRYALYVRGRPVLVETGGTGEYIKSIKYDGVRYPSAVVPEEVPLNEKIEIALGIPETPYLAGAGSILTASRYDSSAGNLVLELKAFKGHRSALEIVSPLKPVSMSLNAEELKTWSWRKDGGVFRIDASLEHGAEEDTVTVRF